MPPIIFIPPVQLLPEVCPDCHKPEQKVEVCAHCGHKYTEPALTFIEVILATVALLVMIYVGIVLFALAFRWIIEPTVNYILG